MFLIYKIIIVGVFLLSVLFYSFNVPYTFLYVVIVVIVHNKEDLRYLLGNKVWEIYLKVRNQKSQVQLLSDREACNSGIVRHSTPIMQNSHMKSTKPTYSPINNDSKTGLFNGLTSTPLSSSKLNLNNSLFLRNKLTPLRSPPLYNLSEVSNVNNKSPKPVQNASGPLLASTRFNVSLGTYSDTKSPGLTNRIVQYNNEAKQKQLLTHQPKYGSPGLFPVVHFFKKDVPTASPQPRKVTVRIASPDTSWYNSPEFGTKKVESKSSNSQNGPSVAQTITDTETRSVLDALKEISRKRIHTTPDFETEQDVCKRQKRTEKLPSSLESTKRSREEDSPVSDSQNKNVIQQTAKKICVVDMLAASYTSSQLYKEKMEKSLKKKAELEKAEKQKKVLNAATQTADPEQAKKATEEDSRMEVEQNTKPFVIPLKKPTQKTDDNTEKPPEQLRNALIFDEGRLEIYRKNRLTTFLCALTGQKPVFLKYEKPQPSPDVELAPEIDTPTTSPPKLVSILSPQNKPKHDKHVTFNLPPENNEDIIQPVSSNGGTNSANNTLISSTVSTPVRNSANLIITSTETPKGALTAPTVTKLDFGKVNPHTEQENISNLPEISFTQNDGSNTHTKSPSKCGLPVMQSQTNLSTTPSTLSFTFGNQNTATTTSVSSLNTASSEAFPMFNSSTTSTSPKTGGFKFDLTKSPSELSVAGSGVSSASSINQNIPSFGLSTVGQIPELVLRSDSARTQIRYLLVHKLRLRLILSDQIQLILVLHQLHLQPPQMHLGLNQNNSSVVNHLY
ncbi:hypothetical protein QE152_g10826 [Popillia japonica]|uniref:Uncharacterized protein n=1 Tax=Popillia japonica TaxID=7064 RepID=A0AAW1LPE0_POPJA